MSRDFENCLGAILTPKTGLRLRDICFILITNICYLDQSANMSWRSQGITGSNNIPLGNRRRFGGDADGDSRNGTESPYGDSGKRGRSPPRGTQVPMLNPIKTDKEPADPSADGVKRRKKRNRWGDATDNKAAGLMGLPTMIQATMTAEQLEAYTLHLRIEEISQKLRINDVVPGEGDRYVSPSPIP